MDNDAISNSVVPFNSYSVNSDDQIGITAVHTTIDSQSNTEKHIFEVAATIFQPTSPTNQN